MRPRHKAAENHESNMKADLMPAIFNEAAA